MSRIGNKQNARLNREWAGHVRSYCKRVTSGLRRLDGKKEIRDRLENE